MWIVWMVFFMRYQPCLPHIANAMLGSGLGSTFRVFRGWSQHHYGNFV